MKNKRALNPMLIGLLVRVTGAVVRVLHATMKVEVRGLENVLGPIAAGRPVMAVAWHGNIFSVTLARLSICVPRLTTMVSRSQDGEIAVRIAGQFGVDFVRASSSKGGAAGLLQISRELRRPNPDGTGQLALHLLNGPRGPCGKAKPGIVKIAELTGAVVVPVEVLATRAWRAKSWDRHQVPLPFSKITLVIGEGMDFGWQGQDEEAAADGDKSDDEARLAGEIGRIEAALNALANGNNEPQMNADERR